MADTIRAEAKRWITNFTRKVQAALQPMLHSFSQATFPSNGESFHNRTYPRTRLSGRRSCSLARQPGAATLLTGERSASRRCVAQRDQVRRLSPAGLRQGRGRAPADPQWPELADRMPAVAAAIAGLGLRSAMLDGELVALQPDGVSSFPMLQAALKAGRDGSLVFYAFDLLHLDGWDLRGCTLLARKRVLEGAAGWNGADRYSGHVVGQAAEMHRSAGRMKLEGIICKRADAPYRPGRSGDWLKVKCLGRDELIVLGWTMPTRSRVGLGALQLGYHDPEGRLHYAGAIGTGFTDRELASLRERLDDMAAPPPADLLVAAGEPIDPATHWVRPELVAEVKYTGWSGSGRVRHGVYLGLRRTRLPARSCARWRTLRRSVRCSRPSPFAGR